MPSMYPNRPFEPKSCVMLVVHDSKFSPLNFCSSVRIVREGVLDDIINGDDVFAILCVCESFGVPVVWSQNLATTGPITYCESNKVSQSGMVVTTLFSTILTYCESNKVLIRP